MSNMLEHFWAAVFLLVSADSIKRRLVSAYATHLSAINEDELPNEIRKEFSDVVRAISHVKPLRGETAVQATVRKMSDVEASVHAARIVQMLGTLTEMQNRPRQKLLRAVNSERAVNADVAD